MSATRMMAAGVIILFALGLPLSSSSADKRHVRGSIVIDTGKGRIVVDGRDLDGLARLKDIQGLRFRRDRRGRIAIDLKGLEVSARKLERSVRRLERNLERKLRRLDSRERSGLRRIRKGFDLDLNLDFDFDFDFDFDWDLN